MKSRLLATFWAYRGRSLFGQRHYEKALKAFQNVRHFHPVGSLPAIWQGYYALTLFYSERYSEALQQMECALFSLRAIKSMSREAYWLNHEILARLREATCAGNKRSHSVNALQDDIESQGW